MLAADSRTSRGKFVSNRGAAKLTRLATNIGICRSGAAADTQAVAGIMQYYLANHQIELGDSTPVAVAANLLQSIVYQNKDNLQAGMLLGGWDDEEGGQVYALPLGGTLLKVLLPVAAQSCPKQVEFGTDRIQDLAGVLACLRGHATLHATLHCAGWNKSRHQHCATRVQVPYAIGGSGSGYITGFIDKHWRTGMTAQEGREFCIRAVSHAFHRDGSSGGCVRMVTVTKDGYKEEFVPHTETPQGYGELPHPQSAGAQTAVAS